MDDLRDWLEKVDKMGQLKRIDGADWDMEIGCAAAMNVKRDDNFALLFDNIKGYPKGYRVVTSSLANHDRLELTLSLPPTSSRLEQLKVVQEKFVEWDKEYPKFPPEFVKTGPVLENVHSGKDVNLFKFPVPKWHELDGGRYIGTAHAFITKDPDKDEVNLGTYRTMLHDERTLGFFQAQGQDGRIHIENYHAKGERCPVALSIGHHPLIFAISGRAVPKGSEYQYVGAIAQEPVKVIKEEITGLPIPADSEIVVVGWIPVDKTKMEGPFGEWPGYYSYAEPRPVIEVERIYHRNEPILLGAQMDRAPGDTTYYSTLTRSAKLYEELVSWGLPDIQSCWMHGAGLYTFIVVSIKQRYAGHAKEVGMIASHTRQATAGRFTIVVDEDIDPSNIDDVIWALCFRVDPAQDIDIIRRARSHSLDPQVREGTPTFSSRAIIDACKPFEWRHEFKKEIKFSPELKEAVKKKWGDLLGLKD